MPKEKIVNVPNTFTAMRLLLLAPVVWLVCCGTRSAALILYVVFLSTDAFDGYFARKLHQETNFGEYFDFVVDFLGYYALLITFMVTGRMAWYNTALIAGATLALVWVTITLARKAGRAYMPHRLSSKFLAVLLIAAIVPYILRLQHANTACLVMLLIVYAYPLTDYIRFTLTFKSADDQDRASAGDGETGP